MTTGLTEGAELPVVYILLSACKPNVPIQSIVAIDF